MGIRPIAASVSDPPKHNNLPTERTKSVGAYSKPLFGLGQFSRKFQQHSESTEWASRANVTTRMSIQSSVSSSSRPRQWSSIAYTQDDYSHKNLSHVTLVHEPFVPKTHQTLSTGQKN